MLPTVLVTGGAGYIGSHTCRRLHAAGFHPVSIDNLERGNRDHVRWGPLEEIDLRQPSEALINAFHRHKPIAVLHFAAYAYVSESMKRPLEYHHNNLNALTNVLLAMAETDVTALVFSSSCAVYGLA